MIEADGLKGNLGIVGEREGGGCVGMCAYLCVHVCGRGGRREGEVILYCI